MIHNNGMLTSNNCPEHVTLGRYSYCHGEFRGNGNMVIIGDFCSIAMGVRFDCGFSHAVDFVSTFPFKTMMPGCNDVDSNVVIKGDIIIGHDVTIGEGAIIMSGVKIGCGAIVGAGAVVTKNVEPYSVVAGSPAVHKKYRFDYLTIRKLENLMWWSWPDQKIIENAHLLSSPNVIQFIKKHIEDDKQL